MVGGVVNDSLLFFFVLFILIGRVLFSSQGGLYFGGELFLFFCLIRRPTPRLKPQEYLHERSADSFCYSFPCQNGQIYFIYFFYGFQ
jgi:hypothetical protein